MAETTNFSFNLTDFDKIPWHTEEHDNWNVLDALLAKYIAIQNVQGAWENALVVTVGQRYIDTDSNTIWSCLVAHTTSSTGTFATDRAANSTYWEGVSVDQTNVGAWTAGSVYAVNDFVMDASRYGVVIAGHTAVTSYDTGVTAGYILTLIDASGNDAVLPALVADEILGVNAAGNAWITRSVSEMLTLLGVSASTATLLVANNLSDLNNAGSARTNLELGTAATSDSTDFLATSASANFQPVDTELTALAGLTSAANKVPMFSGSGTATLIDLQDDDAMSSATATAVGSTESIKAYIDAEIAALAGGPPSGSVIWYAKSTPPTGYLECDGSAVSTTTYADLYAVIGVVFGDPGGGNFNLPDLRGEFVRGYDNGKETDSGRVFGTQQGNTNDGHTHYFTTVVSATGGTTAGYYPLLTYGTSGSGGTSQVNVNTTSGTESRPENVALLPCIKT